MQSPDPAPMNEPQPIAHEESNRQTGRPALGFGCASLFGLPTKRERRVVLESAYDLGIRHFDVAPIYGLGLAEAELAEFIGNRTDIRVATKFGMRPTTVGRLAGLAQTPVRQLLKSSQKMKAKVKSSGQGPDAGFVGRTLYSRNDYSVGAARKALSASLRALRVDRIDYFMLHEPAGALGDDYSDLADCLERECSKGTLGRWGPAGDLSQMDANLAGLCSRATVRQFPYDLMTGYYGQPPDQDRESITFGFMSATLPLLRGLLERDPELRHQCSELLEADLSDERTAVQLLVRNAMTHNQFGTVLVSSTRVENLKTACQAPVAPFRNEAEVATLIRQKSRATRSQ
ncbi:MAG: D-threo-aldose 1-dehydrogenase [Actinomycetota bacterium]|nr:D-threo-aldose 1-dehydrogenase [Actinomycetota bacterium]